MSYEEDETCHMRKRMRTFSHLLLSINPGIINKPGVY